MDRTSSSMLAVAAIGTVMLALPVPPSSAQQPAAATLGEAQMLPGGEWAIGRWEGNVLWKGTSAGTLGLSNYPVLLTVDKDANGKVTCRIHGIPPPSVPSPGRTKRCVIGPNGISLTTRDTAEFELSRSGPDGLQGPVKPPFAQGNAVPGGGAQAHMNRAR